MTQAQSNRAAAKRIQTDSPGESSAVMSAYCLHAALAAQRPSTPTILEQVKADACGRVDADTSAKLFARLWRLAGRYRGVDIELDMSHVHWVAPRFVRELAFLRRHLTHPWRRVVLINVRPECSHLLDSSVTARRVMK